MPSSRVSVAQRALRLAADQGRFRIFASVLLHASERETGVGSWLVAQVNSDHLEIFNDVLKELEASETAVRTSPMCF